MFLLLTFICFTCSCIFTAISTALHEYPIEIHSLADSEVVSSFLLIRNNRAMISLLSHLKKTFAEIHTEKNCWITGSSMLLGMLVAFQSGCTNLMAGVTLFPCPTTATTSPQGYF